MASIDERWHVGKEIPIALIAALLVQTFGAIWWAATISSKLDSLANDMAEFRSERYTKADAARDIDLCRLRYDGMDRRVNLLEQRSNSLQPKLGAR